MSDDVIQKLRQVEILPQLFMLLQAVDNGSILARDFGNNAGSIRLKLNTMKQYLQEIEGINETIEERMEKIEDLKRRNQQKREFLSVIRQQVKQELGGSGEGDIKVEETVNIKMELDEQ